MNRREVLIGIGVASATAAVPIAGANLAKATDRSAWNAALSRYQRTNAEFERLWSLHDKAEVACERDCPRVDRYFDAYKLGFGMGRDRVECFLRLYNTGARLNGKPQLDTAATADEFMAYQEHHQGIRKLHRVDAWEKEASDYGQAHYFPARTALMAVPAPDTDALLVKIGIAAEAYDDEFMECCYADAKRLLGRA